MTLPDFSVLGAYALLLLALLAALFTRRRLAMGLGVAASVAGLLAGVLQLPALAAIALLVGLGAALHRWPRQPVLWALAVLLMLVLALHRWPGFVPHAWWQGVLPGASQPYTVYWHWDKGLAGLWLLLCLPMPQWGTAVARPRLWAVAGLALLAALWLAVGSGLLAWQPKWPVWWLPWLAANLLLVSLPEEALFRQGVFAALAARPLWQRCLASALLFGLVHAGGGGLWVLVAALAGLGYALAYAAGRWLYWPLLLHTGFNVLHLALLSYPR